MFYAKVVFNLPFQHFFYYSVPDKLTGIIKKGFRVKAELKNRLEKGIVVEITNKIDYTGEIKPILDIIEPFPVLTDELINIALWMSKFYGASVYESINCIFPFKAKFKSETKGNIINHFKSQGLPLLLKSQRDAFLLIKQIIKKNIFDIILLSGVVSKIGIYIYAIKEIISNNRNCIFLVPEISTIEPVFKLLKKYLPENFISFIHSELPLKIRQKIWYKVLNNEVKIVIGTRSAIFLPFNNIGLVIIDNEHEKYYKEESSPRYNAKQIAIKRAKLNNALVLLGSISPSLELFHFTLQKKKLISLNSFTKKRIGYKKIVDLRKEKFPISNYLYNEIKNTLNKKEQVFLFLNRRGFANYLFCENCGFVIYCPNCNITMTYHKKLFKFQLVCHYCNYETNPPDICENCGSVKLISTGAGTEKIEEELKKLFANNKIARIDLEITKNRNSVLELLNKFLKKEIDILIGTSMILPWLNLMNIRLLGILLADTIINLPEFRATEWTFDLIAEIVNKTNFCNIVIQTYKPANYAIKSALKNDYYGFYKQEIEIRKKLLFPPFTRVLQLIIRGKDKEKVIENIYRLAEIIKPCISETSIMFGPAPAILSKLKGNYRWQIVIKSKNFELILKKVREFKDKLKDSYLEIDVDPISLL